MTNDPEESEVARATAISFLWRERATVIAAVAISISLFTYFDGVSRDRDRLLEQRNFAFLSSKTAELNALHGTFNSLFQRFAATLHGEGKVEEDIRRKLLLNMAEQQKTLYTVSGKVPEEEARLVDYYDESLSLVRDVLIDADSYADLEPLYQGETLLPQLQGDYLVLIKRLDPNIAATPSAEASQ